MLNELHRSLEILAHSALYPGVTLVTALCISFLCIFSILVFSICIVILFIFLFNLI